MEEDQEYIIALSSEESESEDDVEILEFRNETQNLLNNPPQITKKLTDIQCPICFDDITKATATSCGHIFCLECIQQSIASSNARGQVRGRRGIGLCPLCRKKVSFKDTMVLRMKIATKIEKPDLPPKPKNEEEVNLKEL